METRLTFLWCVAEKSMGFHGVHHVALSSIESYLGGVMSLVFLGAPAALQLCKTCLSEGFDANLYGVSHFCLQERRSPRL